MSDRVVEPEIDVMPRRLIDKKKADNVIGVLSSLDCVSDVLIVSHNYSGGTGYAVGRFIIRIKTSERVDEAAKRISEVCRDLFPHGYDIRIGRFTKTRPTLKDYLSGKER